MCLELSSWKDSWELCNTSIPLKARAEANLGLPAGLILLVQPGRGISPWWEMWALQSPLELKYAEVQSVESQSRGGIFLLRADVFADRRLCSLCLCSCGSVLCLVFVFASLDSQLLSRASGVSLIVKNVGTFEVAYSKSQSHDSCWLSMDHQKSSVKLNWGPYTAIWDLLVPGVISSTTECLLFINMAFI